MVELRGIPMVDHPLSSFRGIGLLTSFLPVTLSVPKHSSNSCITLLALSTHYWVLPSHRRCASVLTSAALSGRPSRPNILGVSSLP